jgi:hypothetical protein
MEKQSKIEQSSPFQLMKNNLLHISFGSDIIVVTTMIPVEISMAGEWRIMNN